MKHIVSIVILFIVVHSAFGQLVQRYDNESASLFSERLKPKNAILTHQVIEAKWNEKPVIIAFYKQSYQLPREKDPDQQVYQKITGAVYIQTEKNSYKKTSFGTIDTEGGEPNIETIFFANADKDKTKELIVIASWTQQHNDVSGTLYGTYVFDYDLASAKSDWTFLEKISKQLDGGCECSWGDGTSKKAKYKKASEVKAALIKLGFK